MNGPARAMTQPVQALRSEPVHDFQEVPKCLYTACCAFPCPASPPLLSRDLCVSTSLIRPIAETRVARGRSAAIGSLLKERCHAQVDLGTTVDSRRGGVSPGDVPSYDSSGEGKLPPTDAATADASTAARLPAPEPRYYAEHSTGGARLLGSANHDQPAVEYRNGLLTEVPYDSKERPHRCA